MMMTPRERRLVIEFERMKALRSPEALFDFRCADLTIKEAKELLHAKVSFDVIQRALPDFLTPEEYEANHQGEPPEKYLVVYHCKGLVRTEDKRIIEQYEHAMEVVFGWGYPAEPPVFIWLTNIWHPNFRRPYICIEGHSFAVGLTLDQIVLEVGRMIQYQNYNIQDPLNAEAAEWASRNLPRFPIDDRDILDRRQRIEAAFEDALVTFPEDAERQDDEQMVELLATDDDAYRF